MDFRFSRFEIVTGTGAVFLCLVFVCLFLQPSEIEDELASTAMATLITGLGTDGHASFPRGETGIYWVALEPDGQRLRLTGAVTDGETRDWAERQVSAVSGVTAVDNRLQVLGTAAECQRPLGALLAERRIAFRPGRDELTPAAVALLADLARVLRGCDAQFEIASHTDARGDSAVSLQLSQRRADIVARTLVGHGVPAQRLRAVGYGGAQPLARNTTEAGRALNRRVEFRVLGAVS